jgi:hypothetical protein
MISVFQYGLGRPNKCENDASGRRYLATVCLMYGTYVANLIGEFLLIVVGLRGMLIRLQATMQFS